MCGFLTILDWAGRSTLNHQALLDQIEHRGPDADGLAFFDLTGHSLQGISTAQPHLALGHRRLAILDLDPRSNQPMFSSDGRYAFVYNGEIYNYVELRRELQGEGCIFRTEGDTEVALTAMIKWGAERALKKFQGMFAFSLFDSKTGTLLTARDQLGIKPLFRAQWDGGYAYASEVWPLLSLPGVSRAPNTSKITQYMTSGGQEHDGTSYYQAIERVPAGCFDQLDIQAKTAPTYHRYWALKIPDQRIPLKDASAVFREAFLKNVRQHLRSDAPVGVALSGGLDSSAIAGAIRHLEPDMELNTFSFLPGDPKWSEEHWIDMCNDHVRAIPNKITPEPGNLIDDLPELLRAQGEPFGTTSIYAQFRVMRLAAQSGVKVILDGQGADELLGGYAPYISARVLSLLTAGRFSEAANLFKAAPNWAAASHKSVLSDLAKYSLPRSWTRKLRRHVSGRFPYDWLSSTALEQAQIFAPGADIRGPRESYLKRTLQEAVTHYGLPELLRYEDRNSMHFSLESRVPFLTAEFSELCMSLPEASLVDSGGRTKSVLRDAINGLIPAAIIERRDKIGFRPDIAGMNRPIVGRFIEEARTMTLPGDIDWDLLLSRLQGLEDTEFGAPWIWRAINLAYWHDMVHRHPILAS